jgi:hypothetical protein
MKISELISKLTALQTDLGDVPVVAVGDIEQDEVKIREVEEVVRMNVGRTDAPRMAVFLDA